MNRIRDEVRRTKRAPVATTLGDDHAARTASPLETAIGHDPGGDRESVLFAASAAVGAMVLARATHDESLAGELLSAVRKRLLEPTKKRR